MSRFDYADPGTDPAYCDNISDDPERDDADCDCGSCDGKDEHGAYTDEYDPEFNSRSKGELCPDCNGDGTKWNHIEGGFLEKVACPECGGKGYYEEEL